MKNTALTTAGALGGIISVLFGGWNTAMTTLAVFMAADYITGFAVAAVFKKSPKSETGALESRAGYKGLLRKGAVLLTVIIAHRLDCALGTGFIKDGVITAYILNEAVSVTENIGLMGVPLPKVILKAIDILKEKSEE